MGPDAGVEMMVDAVAMYNVIYAKIKCDDDLTIRAVSKWSYHKELSNLQSEFQWPRILKEKKEDKRCLPLNVPEPVHSGHSLKASELLSAGMHMINDDQLVDMIPANTQKNVTCASIVAGMVFQDLALWANQLEVSS